MTEAELQAAIIDPKRGLAPALGWLSYHTYDSRRSTPGFLDLQLTRRGILIVAELKSDTGQMTPEQHVWFDAFTLVSLASRDIEFGEPCVKVFLWRPADWRSGAIENVLRAPH